MTSIAADFDPFTLFEDPHPILRRARAEEPVFRDEHTGYWVVTRYDKIKEILSDPETFSAENALEPIMPLDSEVPKILAAGKFGAKPFIVNVDGDAHLERKRIFASVLHPRKVASLEPRIRELARRMLAECPADEAFDLVERFARDFPALVIFDILGFPEHDVPAIKSWAEARMELFFGRLPPEHQREQAHGMVKFWRYIEDHIEGQLDDPGDHFVGDLVRLHVSGEEDVSLNDIACYCFAFLFAGHETTSAQIANMVRDMLTQRETWEAVVADPSLAPAAAEESLRMNTATFNWRRRTTAPVDIDGHELPAGANLFLVYGSANRDSEHFADADRFDIGREGHSRHLGLGYGSHFCSGAALARLELTVTLEEMTSSMPDLRLLDDRELIWVHNVSFCGPRSLWLQRGC